MNINIGGIIGRRWKSDMSVKGVFCAGTCLFLFFLGCVEAFSSTVDDPDEFIRMYFGEKEVVESATRMAKPASQAPENITVITAEQIEAMGVHTVAEALERTPGLFLAFSGRDFGSASHLSIQGSKPRHVLVLVDEIPWNFLAGGNAETITVPIGIVERIEIIRGPASSTWGSALGGVVNIITKRPGKLPTNNGSISSTYGEQNTLDGRAQLVGKKGGVGYYLFAGKQQSDGLRLERDFDNKAFYANLAIDLPGSWVLGVQTGYSTPEADQGDLGEGGILAWTEHEALFWRTSLKGKLSKDFSTQFALFGFSNKLSVEADENGVYAPRGDLFRDIEFDEESYGASAQLGWSIPAGALVFGVDYLKGDLKQTSWNGDFYQFLGAQPIEINESDTAKVGLYTNGTFPMGPWTIVPGIRYDQRSDLDPFWSPSLGITRNIGEETILRALVSRGFTDPGLAELSGGGTFLDPNNGLDPEEVWSYQLGYETSFPELAWVRATVFRHDLDKAHEMVPSPSSSNSIYINSGNIRRTGFELETESAQYYGFSVLAGGAAVRERPEEGLNDSDIYTVDIALRYSSPGFLTADLSGHHIWWDISDDPYEGGYDDFIWDLSLTHTRHWFGKAWELLFKAHNLFNGEQSDSYFYPNPQRWVEAGVRVRF